MEVILHTPVKIYCNSQLDTAWMFNSMRGDVIEREANLYISSATIDHAGTYFCFGSYSKQKYFISSVKLTVGKKYKISSIYFIT